LAGVRSGLRDGRIRLRSKIEVGNAGGVGTAMRCDALRRRAHLVDRKRRVIRLDSRSVPSVWSFVRFDLQCVEEVPETVEVDVRVGEETVLIHQFITQPLPVTKP